MKRRAIVHRLPMSGPDDASALVAGIEAGRIDPAGLRAVLGKTEGNGCVNDFTRGYAVQSLRLALAPYLSDDVLAALPMVMSGGTEGGLSPHWIVLEEGEGSDGPPALAFAAALTASLPPQAIGRMAQVEAVRDATRDAMRKAGITDAADVHFVQIKCPLLTSERIAAAGGDVATTDTLKSMGLSRGASALGVALALGEVAPEQLSDAVIGQDWTLWSARASCSAGVELTACEVVVMGQSEDWAGDLRIGHAVMRDAIDAGSVADLLDLVEPGFRAQLTPPAQAQVLAVLAKTEASPGGMIRGARHVMLEDSDLSATRHARGFTGGLLAGLTGFTELFVSGGAEHQGPSGGGPCAMIYKTS